MTLDFRRILVVMLCGVVLYGIFAVYTGLQSIEKALTSFHWWTLLAALGLACFNYWLRFLKWQFYLGLLKIRGVRPLDSLLVFLSGFVLTVTPGKLGEVFKSAVLSKTHGVPIERSAPIVIAERLTDVIAVIALILLGSAAFSGGLIWAIAGGVCVGLGLATILWQTPARWLLHRLEQTRFRSLAPKLSDAYQSLRVVASPQALLVPTLLSLVGWASEGVALALLLFGFSTAVPVLHSVFFYSTATLAGALVPVPGGLGVAETLIQQQLVHAAAVPFAVATASMLLIRLATLWWAVLVGLVALALLKVRFSLALAPQD